MPAEFHATSPDDLPRIQALLQAAFQSGPDAPNLDAALLRWKYWDAGTSWEGPRSYAIEKDGIILAHGSLWPVEIAGVCAANLLDWAAVKFPPGMGVSLVRRLAEIVPVMISTGGSKATRAIMPRIGFQHVANQTVYVRVLRPVPQYRSRPAEPLTRALPRLARNMFWSIVPPAPTRQWTALRTSEVPDPAANHLLKCPAATVTAWSLQHPRGKRGYFVLSRVGGQCRIARILCPDLAAGYAAAVQVAFQDPDAYELAALSSTLAADQALEANHFRRREQRPVFVHDPKKLISPGAYPLPLDMLDDDMAYLNVPEYPYFA